MTNLATKPNDPACDERLNQINQFLETVLKGNVDGELKTGSSGELGVLEQLLNKFVASHRAVLNNSRSEVTKQKKQSFDHSNQPQIRESRSTGLETDVATLTERLEQFLGAISQDIRTPMNGVLGITQILLNMPLGEGQKDYVQIIHQSNKSLLSVINDILDFSKVEAGVLDLDFISFDLELACHDVADLLQTRVREKEVELVFRYSQKLPKQFIGDPARVRQILTNLVGNAIKYTRSGHVLIEAKLVGQQDDQAVVSIKVEDTGLGVDPTTQQKIVENFSRSSEGGALKYGDIGLSLAICKRLVDLMGGEISIESELGRGTSVLFTLPLKLDAVRERLPLSDLSGVRVLLVEPNPIYSSVYRDYLAGFSMRPEVAVTAEDAVSKLREATKLNKAFQICLVADPMSDGSSVDFSAQVNADPQIGSLALVVLCSEAERGDATKFKDAGYSAYLTQPILLGSFRDTLAAALASLTAAAPGVPIITKYHAAEIELDVRQRKVQLDGHILLAEDIKVNQAVATSMLRKLGLDVTTVSTGVQAVKAWSDGAFDLILMDCKMPEMDGIEATRIIRQMEREQRIESETPIIALAVNMLPTNRQACLDVGMNDALSKPFTIGSMLKLLQHHLQSTQGRANKVCSLNNPDSCVDWSALKDLKQVMGSQFIDMIPAFAETSEAIIGQLAIADAKGDLMTVERLANSLSSVSSGVGAVGLLSLAKMLEMQAKEGKVVALDRQVKELTDAFSKAKQVLEAYHLDYQ